MGRRVTPSAAANDFQPAWLLHARPYRETSALAWLLTLETGRVDAVVRGVRTRKSRYRALLQPFTPLQVSLRGDHQLKTLVGLETTAVPYHYQGESLACAFYANELISRLLLPGQPCPALFRDYSVLLNLVASPEDREPALRRFELSLLDVLGAAPVWHTSEGESLQPGWYYAWQPEQGWCVVPRPAADSSIYAGEHLLDIAADSWEEAATRLAAKRLTRQLLQPFLGTRPLQSRALYQQLRSSS